MLLESIAKVSHTSLPLLLFLGQKNLDAVQNAASERKVPVEAQVGLSASCCRHTALACKFMCVFYVHGLLPFILVAVNSCS